MPFADKVVHVTMSGKVLWGADEWQTGFYVGLAEGPADVPNQAYADLVRDQWANFFSDPLCNISNSYSFDQVKLARLGTDGKYDGSEVVHSYPATAVQGGRTGTPLPPQLALVATLIAGSGKGHAGKGRMYLPGVSTNIDSSGHIAANEAKYIADQLRDFFAALHGNFDQPGVPINASKGAAKFGGLGARNVPINGIRVGNVYDTQRRRRNAISETYQISAAIP